MEMRKDDLARIGRNKETKGFPSGKIVPGKANFL